MIEIALLAELIATVIATIFYGKYKNTAFKYLLPYLWVMIAMENLNKILTIPDFWQFVRWNLFSVLGSVLFMFMFRSEILSRSKRNIISLGIAIVILLYIGQSISAGFGALYTVSKFSQNVLLITTIAIYAADLFSRTQFYRLDKDPVIWIAISYLILSTSFPVIQTAKILYYGTEPLFSNIMIVMTTVVILMYAVLSFGLIWSKKRY